MNKQPGHYEIIESIINKYSIIIKNKNINQIYLSVSKSDKSFSEYIKKKYPSIIFENINNYDYFINCSVYPKHYDDIVKFDKKNHFFISHDIDPRIKLLENVFFLTPLANRFFYADIMPHMSKKNMNEDIPIYVVQGHFGGTHSQRRNLDLLLKILKENYKKKFKIRFIGRGEIPKEFNPYLNKIDFIRNLDFVNYHKQFLDVYAIFTLTLKETNPQYYKKKLTSTINYIRGYKLKAIIDKDLNDIYKLPDVELYTSKNDIVSAFKRTLDDFYKKYKNDIPYEQELICDDKFNFKNDRLYLDEYYKNNLD